MALTVSTTNKYNSLQKIFAEMGKVLIAYSGGVDSSLLLKVGTDVLKENCFGVIGVSPSLASQEYEQALQQAKLMGAEIQSLNTNEIKNSLYVLNNQDRCYFCKSELFDQLNILAAKLDVKYIVEGSNFDDLDDYRPGMKAAGEKQIRSPLVEANLHKNEIRELAKHLKIPSWDKPSQPCLSSRVAYGVEINPAILEKINQAEIFIKKLGFKIVRVRYFENHVSVEVGKNETAKLFVIETKNAIETELKYIGFRKILFDSEGYQSGKLNTIQKAS